MDLLNDRVHQNVVLVRIATQNQEAVVVGKKLLCGHRRRGASEPPSDTVTAEEVGGEGSRGGIEDL